MLRDVRNEFVSPRSAREDYGVVPAGEPLVVDEAATAALRQRLRSQRNRDVVPVYNWGERLATE